MNIITPKGKANELVMDISGLISKTFFTPYTLIDIKTRICAYNLAIEFSNNIIDSFRFYDLSKIKYWKQVRTELIEMKLYFYESQNKQINEELEKLKDK